MNRANSAACGPLRIAVIGGSDTKGGGASRIALDLVEVLNKAGHQASHFVALNGKADSPARRSFYGAHATQNLAEQAEQKLRRFGIPLALPLDLPALLIARLRRNFDLLHFHDLGAGMSPITIALYSLRMPTAWTFHDCSPFTGGCLYPMDCKRYQTRCGTDGGCPQLGHWPLGELHDFTGPLQTMKAYVHRMGRIKTIAPTDWLADMAYSSGKVPVRPKVVSNGIDVAVFRPAPDRAALRQESGLPQDQPIILLTAAQIADARKGMNYALDALKAMPELKPFALIVGTPNPALEAALAGIPHRITGHIAAKAEIAR